MREIKFRAWVETTTESYMAYQGTPDLETLQALIHHFGDRPLEQFTGLQDKSGRDIYEGDIVESNKGIRAVAFWSNERSCFSVRYPNTYGRTHQKWIYKSLRWAREKCVIIGNIHEHPALLEAH